MCSLLPTVSGTRLLLAEDNDKLCILISFLHELFLVRYDSVDKVRVGAWKIAKSQEDYSCTTGNNFYKREGLEEPQVGDIATNDNNFYRLNSLYRTLA